MELEVELVPVGVSPDGVPWPDPLAPKPDNVTDSQWQVVTMKAAGMANSEVADQMGVSISSVNGHIKALRQKFGPEYLRSEKSRRNRTPSVVQSIASARFGEVSAAKWRDIREIMSSDFGLVSVKALKLAEAVLDRYLADTPEGEDLRASLEISDAKQLAALAVAIGDRADKMAAPVQGPDAFTPGGSPSLFGQIDRTARDMAGESERVAQLELVVARFAQHEIEQAKGKDEAIETTES